MPRQSGKLEAGWVRYRLVLALAAGDKNQVELAQEFGAVQSSISEFATRHADEIATQREKLKDEFAQLWIADKLNRVAEYQADVEAINTALEAETDPAQVRTKLAIMRQVAEELGQLTERVEIGGKLTYVVEGIDPKALS